jgi:DNA invertase Pin-like site-specific DNA recombinase
VLLVDDSSRVSRDLADAVRFMQQVKFYGIRVIYISQSIDSDSEQAETLAAVHGIVDSLYLRELSKKVKRGLAGQVSRGFATGSSTYGYRTIPVPDPTGKHTNGYPVVLGHRVEVEPNEARVIVQIFEWFADGLGVRRIVERLNQTRTNGPRGGRWKHGAVRYVLTNEKYTGKLLWGQRRTEREPGSHRRVARPAPREQWHVQERPDLQIVGPELWERVRRRHAEVRQQLPAGNRPTLMRGRNAALHSRYLFSGFMRCAECGGSIVAVHATGTRTARYGCSQASRNGTAACSNRLTIRTTVVDQRLLAALRDELLKPSTVKYICEALATELNRRREDRPRRREHLQQARVLTTERLQRLIRSIEDGAPAQSLMAAIRAREAELQQVEAQLTELDEPLEERLAVMPTWVRQQVNDLAGLLGDTPERTKAEFRRLRLTVTLQRVRTESGAFYRASASADFPPLAGSRDFPGTGTDASLR